MLERAMSEDVIAASEAIMNNALTDFCNHGVFIPKELILQPRKNSILDAYTQTAQHMAVQLLSPEIKAGILLSLNLHYHNSLNPLKTMPPLMTYLTDEMAQYNPVARYLNQVPSTSVVEATAMQIFGIRPDTLHNRKLVSANMKESFRQENPDSVVKTPFSYEQIPNYEGICGWLSAFDHGAHPR